ncbi:hypothetical protein P2H44_14730 [Albimonas sp. CAU 1670]|uniref:hypothetical protein n=1 Tax=Albimonas sp. CAU 1670 TaxID=3032599 RepID=UPI0023DA3ECB|nr:hypothetical protein [Albimonas sp. CAU 1670]MDF2233813.1 hypothetical protein [Albimonas sp. CAU 1670]
MALLATLFGPGSAAAQSDEWTYRATVYGWFSALDSSVETRRGKVETSLDFGDVWDALDFAGFAAVEARRNRWSLLADINYSALGGSEPTPFGVLFSRAEVDTTLLVVSGYVGYALVDTPSIRLDAAAGLRYIDLDFDTRLVAAAAARNRAFSSSDGWVDPVAGLRLHVPLTERLGFDAFGDVGGFGIGGASSPSWQIYAGLGWRVGESWSLRAGWRSMTIDKEIDGRDVSVGVHGPVAGVSIAF